MSCRAECHEGLHRLIGKVISLSTKHSGFKSRCNLSNICRLFPGRGPVWSGRLPVTQEIEGSNPFARAKKPTLAMAEDIV